MALTVLPLREDIMDFNPTDHPHRRLNLLTGEYVLVSPHRTKRPWQGQTERPPQQDRPQYDPTCYLCPGNERAGGLHNPAYEGTFVFTNDFAALLPDTPQHHSRPGSMLRSESVRGTSRVICFSPRHDLTLALMETADIRRVVDVWAEQVTELGKDYAWVQVFENRGEAMGASNPHPHGQVWACDFVPNEATNEDRNQLAYYEVFEENLLVEYAALEIEQAERVVIANDHWLVVVPYWAVWPFETLVLPRRHVLRLPDLIDDERDALADILKRLTTRYDNLFETSFPYSMGWHGAPTMRGNMQHWQLHAHFYPPLLRSASVRKFMVGFEMLAESQRDLTPEQAAERLRGQSEKHYRLG
jgi:UDPglucose--hexose-1-phosphate uridylyltransferase